MATMSEHRTAHATRAESGWVTGLGAFAAVVMMIVGFFHGIAGIAALFEDEFFVVTSNYVFDVDVTAGGWIQLVLGVVVFFAGWGILTGATWARVVGMTLAVISAIANFFFIPYYPFWSILMIALAVYVIWAVTRAGVFDS